MFFAFYSGYDIVRHSHWGVACSRKSLENSYQHTRFKIKRGTNAYRA
ncbi:hypothetical protein Xkoz_03407 [Xenorhabdus kozodoii]|uniref:Transposase n=1 Tax=Xenorhabdus kozodoii TaxID=351676 RepID=A0A2D0L197_9GAMM|nr:hypothetical protein Xkoz_03407 [Xenorhabdus kozodoii]